MTWKINPWRFSFPHDVHRENRTLISCDLLSRERERGRRETENRNACMCARSVQRGRVARRYRGSLAPTYVPNYLRARIQHVFLKLQTSYMYMHGSWVYITNMGGRMWRGCLVSHYFRSLFPANDAVLILSLSRIWFFPRSHS